MRDAGHWGWVLDDEWRVVYATDGLRRAQAGGGELARWRVGYVIGSPEWVSDAQTWFSRGFTSEQIRAQVAIVGPFMLADLPGGRQAVA